MFERYFLKKGRKEGREERSEERGRKGTEGRRGKEEETIFIFSDPSMEYNLIQNIPEMAHILLLKKK